MSELEDVLRRLAARPDDDSSAVLELVERAATLPGGLAALTRLATSSDRGLVSHLSYVLADTAPSVTPSTSGLVYDLARALGDCEDATLSNCLTAIHRQAMYGLAWPPTAPPRDVLHPLVMRALAGGPSSLACDAALGALIRLYEQGLFTAVFDAAQLGSLRTRLVELAAQLDEPMMISGLADFVADGRAGAPS